MKTNINNPVSEFINDNIDIIDSNKNILQNIATNYKPLSYFVASKTIAHSSPSSKQGFGSAKVVNISSEILGDPLASIVMGDSNVLPLISHGSKAFSFNMLPFLARLDIGEFDQPHSIESVVTQSLRGLYSDWDSKAFATIFNSAKIEELEFTMNNVTTALSSNKSTLEERSFDSYNPNNYSVVINKELNTLLDLPYSQYSSDTNKAQFEKVLDGAQYKIMSSKMFNDLVEMNIGIKKGDSLMLMINKNDSTLHHGFLPQIYKHKEKEGGLGDYYIFGYNNAALEVSKNSCIVNLFKEPKAQTSKSK